MAKECSLFLNYFYGDFDDTYIIESVGAKSIGDTFGQELISNPMKMSPSNEALSPTVYNEQKICSKCELFLITTGMKKQHEGMSKWWKGLDNIGEPNSTTIDQKSYQEFLMLYSRIVNLSEVCLIRNKGTKNWNQLGEEALRDMTEDLTTTLKPSSQRHQHADDILQYSHDAYKVMAFNNDQQLLL